MRGRRFQVHEMTTDEIRAYFDRVVERPLASEYELEFSEPVTAEWPEGAEINRSAGLAALRKGDVIEFEGRRLIIESIDGRNVKCSPAPE